MLPRATLYNAALHRRWRLPVETVLLGLRHPRETAVRLLGEIPGMRESDTYQMILEEGRAEGRLEGRAEGRLEGRSLGRLDGAKQALRLVAVPRLGEPDLTTRRRIEDEPDLSEVEAWLRRIMQIESWTELFPAVDR